jgi:hypothetical protein
MMCQGPISEEENQQLPRRFCFWKVRRGGEIGRYVEIKQVCKEEKSQKQRQVPQVTKWPKAGP